MRLATRRTAVSLRSSPQITNHDDIHFVLDRHLVPPAAGVLALLDELRVMGDRIVARDGGCRRACFKTQPFKILLHNLLKSFLEMAPITQVYNVAVSVDVRHGNMCYSQVVYSMLEILRTRLEQGCKDMGGFLTTVMAFVEPMRTDHSVVEFCDSSSSM